WRAKHELSRFPAKPARIARCGRAQSRDPGSDKAQCVCPWVPDRTPAQGRGCVREACCVEHRRMTSELWSAEDAQAATGGRLLNAEAWNVNGVSIDTRTLEPGDLFVALKDVRDGHDFLAQAFVSGA